MSTERSVEHRISAWLTEEAAGDLPDRVLQAVFDETRRAPQPGRPLDGRFVRMSRSLSALVAVGAAAIVIAVGALILLRPPSGPGGNPTASPGSPSASAFDPCLVGTWTTTPLSQNSPADDQTIAFSGGAGEVYTIDAQGGVTIDTRAAQKVTFVVPGGQTFTATPSGTGKGTLTTSIGGGAHLFQYTPSGDTTLSTTVVGSQDGQLPPKPDVAFGANYTCVPGQSLSFYHSIVDQFMLDGAVVTLTAGRGTSSPASSPSSP